MGAPQSGKIKSLPRGICRLWVKKDGRKAYEIFQAAGRPNGVKKTFRVCISPRGEKAALAMAVAKRKEWEVTSKPWGGAHYKRIRINADSVPAFLKFKGLEICRNRAVLMATRKFKDSSGRYQCIYLCFPYSIEGGSLPSFMEALEGCRKGQGVLNGLDTSILESAWKKNKAANRVRKRAENLNGALLTFDAFKNGFVSKSEVAAFNHAYDHEWRGRRKAA